MQRFTVWFSLFIIFFSPALFALEENPVPARFISFADIHFNPFSYCRTLALSVCPIVEKLSKAPATQWQAIFEKEDSKAIAEFTHDTNYALLKSSLAEIHIVYLKDHPLFAIGLGDFLAHHFHTQYILATHDRNLQGYQSFVKKTFQFLTQEIHNAMPDIEVYLAIGNNDSYSGDYSVQPGGDFLRETAATWATLLSNSDNQHNLRTTFPVGGYYAVTLPGDGKQKLLVLDTVLFSTAEGAQRNAAQAAKLELAWLRKQLETATQQQQAVLLAYHIPDGVNVYMTLLNISHGIDEFWQPQYSKEFNDILKQYADTIKAILPGHTHMDSFQVINVDHDHNLPVSYTPAISPIFGNNPGFKIYSYAKTKLELSDYDTYFYTLSEAQRLWRKEYNFNEVYHRDCKECDLIKGMKNLTPSGTLADNYKQFYAVGTEAQPIRTNHYWLPYYWCNIFDSRMSTYLTCIKH